MLQSPPKDIGWEDYWRITTPKIRNSKEKKIFSTNTLRINQLMLMQTHITS